MDKSNHVSEELYILTLQSSNTALQFKGLGKGLNVVFSFMLKAEILWYLGFGKLFTLRISRDWLQTLCPLGLQEYQKEII